MSISKNLHLTTQDDLIRIMQDPHFSAEVGIPAYAAMAELARRKEMQKAAPQPQQAKPSVAQQMLQEAQPQPGVAALPVPDHMYQEKSMAAGGIVAFDEGGEVPHFNGEDGSDVSQADIDYAAWQRGTSPAFGRIAFPAYYGLGAMADWAKGKRWVTDPATGKLVRASALEKPAVVPPNPNTPEGAEALRQQRTADFLAKQAQDNLNDPYYNANRIAYENKHKIEQDIAAGKYDNIPGGPGGPGSDAGNKPPRPRTGYIPDTTNTGLPSLNAPKIQYDEAGYNEAMLPKRDAAAEAARWKNIVGENQGLTALQDRLTKMEEKAGKEEEQAPWMALVRAGLGMAAGKSPFALQNIAEGATAGLKDYTDAKARLDAAEEKRFGLQSQISQARRSEDLAAAKFGTDSEQYADTQNRLAKLHALDAKNTAKIHDAANELTAQGNAIKAQEAQWTHQYQMGSLANQAAQVAKLSDYETSMAEAKKDPAYYKVVDTPQGKQRIFDVSKFNSDYRGFDTKQAALLAPLYDKLEKTFDPNEKAAIQAQINRVINGIYGGDTTAAPTGPRQKPLSAF